MSIGPAPDEETTRALLRTLRRQRAKARAVLLFERVWPEIWPALGIAGVFICLALLDVLPMLTAWPHAIVLGLFAIAVVTALARGLRSVAPLADSDADRRLEQASGLKHRPLAVLTDKPAFSGGDTLWRAHVARAAAQLRRVRVGLPRPVLAARDRRALRGGLVVALVACLVVAGGDAPLRLARALVPAFAPPPPTPATQLQAWITPPGYTGMAPVFLKPGAPDVTAPAGSHLTVSLTGGNGTPSLTLAGHAQTFQALDANSFQADQDLTTGGRLEVRRRGRSLGAWELTVVADTAPMVRFPEAPGRARGGSRVPQTRLPWQVSHQYGVVSLQAELRLRDRPGAPPIIVPIPLPGGAPKTAKGDRVQDLTANPWAGLPVTARLVAKDAPGLSGVSEDATFVLPERRFENPIARALMEVRKELSRDPDARAPAIVDLDQIAGTPGAWNGDHGAFLNLADIIAQLRNEQGQDAVDSAQRRMWLLALHLEESAPERTARELEQARQALRDLVEQQKQGEKIDPAELDRRLKDVQAAIEKHMEALAEQARRDPASQEEDPEARQLDARDAQRLAEEARKDAQDGKMDDAQQKLAELDQLLQDLENARPEHGQMTERQRQRAEQRQRGQQQMNALQDIVRREGSLLDQAHQRDAERQPETPSLDQRRPFIYPPQRFAPPAPPPPLSPEQQAQEGQARAGEQKVQQALRRALGELMQQYGDLTGQVPPNLGDADSAMRDAMQQLAQAQDGPAASAEQKAIEALQKGGRSMSMQMAQQFGQSPGQQGEPGDDGEDQDGDGDQPGGQQDGNQPGGGRAYGRDDGRGTRPWEPYGRAERRADDRRDPLGRPLHEGTSGTDESGDVRVPEKMEQARTREIQDELRRRDGERERPQPELDYLDRLLKNF